VCCPGVGADVGCELGEPPVLERAERLLVLDRARCEDDVARLAVIGEPVADLEQPAERVGPLEVMPSEPGRPHLGDGLRGRLMSERPGRQECADDAALKKLAARHAARLSSTPAARNASPTSVLAKSGSPSPGERARVRCWRRTARKPRARVRGRTVERGSRASRAGLKRPRSAHRRTTSSSSPKPRPAAIAFAWRVFIARTSGERAARTHCSRTYSASCRPWRLCGPGGAAIGSRWSDDDQSPSSVPDAQDGHGLPE
jgi:hypothetical protein